jgi:hypothetical protein
MEKVGWGRFSPEKIRTVWFLAAMIPLIVIVGLTTLIIVILAVPITLAGMLSWYWKTRSKQSVRLKLTN